MDPHDSTSSIVCKSCSKMPSATVLFTTPPSSTTKSSGALGMASRGVGIILTHSPSSTNGTSAKFSAPATCTFHECCSEFARSTSTWSMSCDRIQDSRQLGSSSISEARLRIGARLATETLRQALGRALATSSKLTYNQAQRMYGWWYGTEG